MTEAQRTCFLFDITTSRKYCDKNKATRLCLWSKFKISSIVPSCQQLVLVLCFFQATETIVKQSACVFSLGNFLNDYRTCFILQISRFTTRYSCIHTEPAPPGNANTFYGEGEYVLLFSETAHSNTRKISQNKAGNESLNKPLIKQNKPAVLLVF